jgi:3',5'-cyclic AMP phosphodiesterase CpdA
MRTFIPKAAASRRDALKLTALGGVVFASHLLRGVAGCNSSGPGPAAGPTPGPLAGTPRGAEEDFFFLQLSDPHWGFTGPMVNPEPTLELPSAVAAINASASKPDFVIFTGDLTHNTDDGTVRRMRMMEFLQIASTLDVAMVKYIPGEHDAGDDGGAAFKEIFGDTYYSFDHKGIHFIALDNVSDPTSNLGDTQLAWLKADLAPLDAQAPIVVFAHKPLWLLRPDWDWLTFDGPKATDMLMPFENVTIFFGHIHQELQYMTGHIPHYAARSLMFVLPSPDADAAVPNPLPWNPAEPNAGLGYRSVAAGTTPSDYQRTEIPLAPPVVVDDGGLEGGETADAGGMGEAGDAGGGASLVDAAPAGDY